jgi:hypothetical protein
VEVQLLSENIAASNKALEEWQAANKDLKNQLESERKENADKKLQIKAFVENLQSEKKALMVRVFISFV